MTLGFNPLSDTPLSTLPATGGAGAYTLTASGGSFTLSGIAAGLKATRTLTASTGSFSLSGQNATLRSGRALSASAATFTLTGQSAGLRASRSLTAATGNFTLTGQATGLRATRTLVVSQGAFTLAGQAAVLQAARFLPAGIGAYTLTGQNATLTYTPVGGYTLTAAPGGFTLSGQSATFIHQSTNQSFGGWPTWSSLTKPRGDAPPVNQAQGDDGNALLIHALFRPKNRRKGQEEAFPAAKEDGASQDEQEQADASLDRQGAETAGRAACIPLIATLQREMETKRTLELAVSEIVLRQQFLEEQHRHATLRQRRDEEAFLMLLAA